MEQFSCTRLLYSLALSFSLLYSLVQIKLREENRENCEKNERIFTPRGERKIYFGSSNFVDKTLLIFIDVLL